MFIKKLSINNFRLFKAGREFVLDDLNVPDSTNEGSGLNVFVGENGFGKTAILEAISLPILKYRADNFTIRDFEDPNKHTLIELYSDNAFNVSKTIRGSFQSKGFIFEAKIRARGVNAYLSKIIVNDQLFIKADGETSPADESPDLRANVNNPFKGPRFNENIILYLDKNRIFQIRSGSYNPTRFDQLMEDFSYQYIRNSAKRKNINSRFKDIFSMAENKYLDDALRKYEEICGTKIKIDFIENWQPFAKAFFAERKPNNMQVALDMQGSGYEMIFSLLYSFYLSKQAGKQLIILLDEPELHLHPFLLESFASLLLHFSKESQVFITTHSPLLIKYISSNSNVSVNVLSKKRYSVTVIPLKDRVLPYVSAGEINYLAFNLTTEEYQNELYEELKYLLAPTKSYNEFDIDYFQSKRHEVASSPLRGIPNQVSIHTFIRNQIHHPKENGRPDRKDIENSIIRLRKYLKRELDRLN